MDRVHHLWDAMALGLGRPILHEEGYDKPTHHRWEYDQPEPIGLVIGDKGGRQRVRIGITN